MSFQRSALYLSALAVITFILTVAFFSPSKAQQNQCPPLHSYSEFMAMNAKLPELKITYLTNEGIETLLNHLNGQLTSLEQPPLTPDTVVIGYFKAAQDGSDTVGVAMFKQGCVIIDSVVSMPRPEFLKLLVEAGVTRDMIESREGA